MNKLVVVCTQFIGFFSRFSWFKHFITVVFSIVGLFALTTQDSNAGIFQDDDSLMVYVAPISYHFHPKNYNNHINLIGLEWASSCGWDVGAAIFNNSYRQDSQYIYVGKRFDFSDTPDNTFYFKVTAGPMFGYRDPHDKLPVSTDNIALGIIPAIGYKYKRFNAQFIVLGTSALTASVGIDLWK